jgi:RNA polymerase sigma factor for flagellar operon FliA
MNSQAPDARVAVDEALDAQGAQNTEEARLWRSWRSTGDEPAREALLAMHLPYARVVAAMIFAQRSREDLEFDDYLQLARIGMLEAFDRYDPDKGAQFRTFAARRMRGAVLDGLAHMTERQEQMAHRRRLLAERIASVAPPAAHRPADVFQYLAEVGMGLAIGFMLEDTGMFSAGDDASATWPDPSYRAVELRHTHQQLRHVIGQLPPAERRVIQLHYQQGHAFEDIASELELTKGRISQIHKKALSCLRELLALRGSCDQSF